MMLIEILGLHLHQVAGHAVAFELEDPGAVWPLPRISNVSDRQGDVVEVEIDPVALLDQIAGALHDRQCDKPEEVHLEHAQLSRMPISNWVTVLMGDSSDRRWDGEMADILRWVYR